MEKKFMNFDDIDLAMVLIAILAGIGIFVVADPAAIIIGAITAISALARGLSQIITKKPKTNSDKE